MAPASESGQPKLAVLIAPGKRLFILFLGLLLTL